MSSPVTDLETGLQAMLNLKPPGVSGSRITSLTSLCVANIQSESVLIQKIYTHFKKTPGTHKLGVLYVVDSVTRKWLEQAKAQGQPINSSAPDGTYAAGVHRVTELMPVLMNDISQSAPEDQKLACPSQYVPSSLFMTRNAEISTTPPGSPPPNVMASLQGNLPASSAAPAPAPAAANGSSILEALANIARQNTTSNTAAGSAGPSNGSLPAPAASYSMPASALPQPVSSSHAPSSYPAASQPVNAPSVPFNLAQMLGQNAPAQAMPASAAPQMPAAAGAVPGGMDPSTQQQIMLIKLLADQGVPFDKIPALIQSMTGGAVAGQPAPAPAPAAQGSFPAQPAWGAPSNGSSRDDTRNRAYGDGGRSPQRFHGTRSRSRSPDRWGQRGSPRGGRDFSGRTSPPRGRHEDRDRNGRRGNEFRQRSPAGRRGRSPSPSGNFPHVDRWIEYDPTLPPNSIRVLSRTLFVGGVTCPEPELRSIFGRYGTVQTCIVNKDKRHAFVKMLTRKDAENAKTSMEDNRHLDIPLRTRWGVGFGPRDCSDYATGVSIIPIPKLTEADRKWMLTAPYGGSGGRPIEAGLCVEEPDIEIGAGVSSKAISRRMQTDKGGQNGPKSTRQRDDDWRQDDHGGQQRGGNGHGAGLNQGQAGQMPGFPFGIGTLPNGMPNFPQGFQFPQ
ncbi:RNA binding protein Nrd1 [Cordyceps javanica]|nr:RNA binding protein Nrd1 [Cordyceps javanica]